MNKTVHFIGLDVHKETIACFFMNVPEYLLPNPKLRLREQLREVARFNPDSEIRFENRRCSGGRPRLPWSRGVPPGGSAREPSKRRNISKPLKLPDVLSGRRDARPPRQAGTPAATSEFGFKHLSQRTEQTDLFGSSYCTFS